MEHEELYAAAEAPLPDAFEATARSRAAAEDDLLGRENVVGVGIGRKIKDGVQTETPSVMVLVSHKLPPGVLGSDLVPKTVGRQPTDVLEVGTLFAGDDAAPASDLDVLTLRERVRPVRPGYSVGHPSVTAGTMAVWAAADAAGAPRIAIVTQEDRARADFRRVLADLRGAFGTRLVPLELPVGEEQGFHEIADVFG